jgi:hypothetical protein
MDFLIRYSLLFIFHSSFFIKKTPPQEGGLQQPSPPSSWGSPSRLRNHLRVAQQLTRQRLRKLPIPKGHYTINESAVQLNRRLDERWRSTGELE